MSLLIRPTIQSTRSFLSRPNTFTVNFPTGATLHFTLPFPPKWLNPLRTPELAFLRAFLNSMLDEIRITASQTALSHILCLRRTISLRLSRAHQLTAVEKMAWASGHGIPVFDAENRMLRFDWAWDALYFEFGVHVVAWVVRWLFEFQKESAAAARYTVRLSDRFQENEITYKKCRVDGHEVVEWICNGEEKVCVWVYGACFRDTEEWEFLKDGLEAYEVELLENGLAKIRNTVRGGWELVIYVDGDEADVEDLYPSSRPASDHLLNRSEDSDLESFDRYVYGDDVERVVALASGLGALAHSSSASSRSDHDEAVKHTPPVPPRVGDLLHQAETLVSAIRGINSQLSSTDEKQSPSTQYSQIPPVLQTQPLPSQFTGQTVRLPRPAAARQPRTLQRYQAYAEDDDVEDSITAFQSSWRDI